MLKENARKLRKNMTDAERALWSVLRRKQLGGHRFRKQVPIGKFIVDFMCLDARLIVELDGGQHSDAQPADAERDAWLLRQGFRVLRFWNHDVMKNQEGVLTTIVAALEARP